MMAEKHPNELELLSFVEEDLGAGARRGVAEHPVACRTCTEQVRRLEAGREARCSAPSLESSRTSGATRSSPPCRSASIRGGASDP